MKRALLVALAVANTVGAQQQSPETFHQLGHAILRERSLYHHDHFLDILQGMFVSVAMLTALQTLLRRWLCKFARLEAEARP